MTIKRWSIPRRGRWLVCTVCGESIDVLEAAQGARSDEEHRFLDPAKFRCGQCMEKAGEVAGVETIETELASA